MKSVVTGDDYPECSEWFHTVILPMPRQGTAALALIWEKIGVQRSADPCVIAPLRSVRRILSVLAGYPGCVAGADYVSIPLTP